MLHAKGVDRLGVVGLDDLQGLLREDLGVLSRLGGGLGIVGPAGGDGRVAVFPEQSAPTVPTAWQQPQAMYEHDRPASRLVRALYLLQLLGGEWHDRLRS